MLPAAVCPLKAGYGRAAEWRLCCHAEGTVDPGCNVVEHAHAKIAVVVFRVEVRRVPIPTGDVGLENDAGLPGTCERIAKLRVDEAGQMVKFARGCGA